MQKNEAQKARRRISLSAFAEALSVSGAVRTAAEAAGVSEVTGHSYMAEIKRELGRQAQ